MNPSALLNDFTKTLRERPAIVVGGLVALFIGVQLLNRGGGDTEAVSEALDDPAAEPPPAPPAYNPTPGQIYGGGYSYDSYMPPDDFYQPWPTPSPTPAPSPAPSPTPSPTPTPAPTPTPSPTPSPTPKPGKCGPKPPIADQQRGKGDYKCQGGRWVWVPKTRPDPSPGKGGCGIATVRLGKGRYRLLAINGNRITGHTIIQLAAPATWCAGDRLSAFEPPDNGKRITVAPIRSGQYAGAYINVGAAGVTWRKSK